MNLDFSGYDDKLEHFCFVEQSQQNMTHNNNQQQQNFPIHHEMVDEGGNYYSMNDYPPLSHHLIYEMNDPNNIVLFSLDKPSSAVTSTRSSVLEIGSRKGRLQKNPPTELTSSNFEIHENQSGEEMLKNNEEVDGISYSIQDDNGLHTATSSGGLQTDETSTYEEEDYEDENDDEDEMDIDGDGGDGGSRDMLSSRNTSSMDPLMSNSLSSKKRGCFSKQATNKLKHWLFQNLTVINLRRDQNL